MNIDDLTYKQIKELQNIFGQSSVIPSRSHPYKIGEKYLVRTVTHIMVGRLVFVGEQELLFEDASWVADTGRFADALQKGLVGNDVEIEPFPNEAGLGRGSIIDFCKYEPDLPRTQK